MIEKGVEWSEEKREGRKVQMITASDNRTIGWMELNADSEGRRRGFVREGLLCRAEEQKENKSCSHVTLPPSE